MNYKDIIREDRKRLKEINKEINQLTGEGCGYGRKLLHVPDLFMPFQYIPPEMEEHQVVKGLRTYGTVKKYFLSIGVTISNDEMNEFNETFISIRCKYDFLFWAIMAVRIKNKNGGENIPFLLNRPQLKLLSILEDMRLHDKPIRAIILKARQWGGSTLTQMYIAWIQLIHKEGFYSAIVAQDQTTSRKIRAMYSKMLEGYPAFLLGAKKTKPIQLTPYEGSANDAIITQGGETVRDTVISVGTAERPSSIRGGDVSLAHFSEVAFWKKTEGKTPEEIVRSVSSSILLKPYTMDVMESTANGTGGLFHKEWLSAEKGESDRVAIFVAWYEIEMYATAFDTVKEREDFAKWLYNNRKSELCNDKSESASYYWNLWLNGATLENLKWYIQKRKSYSCHADMAAEFPSDAVEAFKHSGQKVFNLRKTEELRRDCIDTIYRGDVHGNDVVGPDALENIRFIKNEEGLLKVWEMPDTAIKISNRYLTVVDVGGRSKNADYSVILVLDRIGLMYGEGPAVVAEWYGHIRHDLLAWKMAQIAKWYGDALLVVESNTYETKDKERDTDGLHTEYILNQIADAYSNMYARESSEEDIREGRPRKWGFHTNTATKPTIIDCLNVAIEEHSYIERDDETINEFQCYEKKENGSVGAIAGKHDDKLMTRAIGLWISKNLPIPREVTENQYRLTKKRVGSASSF